MVQHSQSSTEQISLFKHVSRCVIVCRLDCIWRWPSNWRLHNLILVKLDSRRPRSSLALDLSFFWFLFWFLLRGVFAKYDTVVQNGDSWKLVWLTFKMIDIQYVFPNSCDLGENTSFWNRWCSKTMADWDVPQPWYQARKVPKMSPRSAFLWNFLSRSSWKLLIWVDVAVLDITRGGSRATLSIISYQVSTPWQLYISLYYMQMHDYFEQCHDSGS